MEQMKPSIFQRYYSNETFDDRFTHNPSDAVDVIIPIIHTNELWRANLTSAYREIPIKRLLIGDGGCIDESIQVAQQFPRVVVFDHRQYKTLGYSIRKLVEEVNTDWFIYLHSDVFLPDGWFDAMLLHRSEYDWFECNHMNTILVEYFNDFRKSKRGFGFGGSHLGRKTAFDRIVDQVDDDFLYRNEDIIFQTLLEEKGAKCGKIPDIIHYHQTMFKTGCHAWNVESVHFTTTPRREEEIRTFDMQIRGFVKYLRPINPVVVNELHDGIFRLMELNSFSWKEFIPWVTRTNPEWLSKISRWKIVVKRLKDLIKSFYYYLFS